MADTQYIDKYRGAKTTDEAVNFATAAPPMEYAYTRKYANNKNNQAHGDFRKSTEYGVDKSRGYTQEQYDKDPTELYKHQNANIAKGQGPGGMFNNKDYNTTLRLAREADAYNAAPRAHHMVIGLNNQIQDLGLAYDKPKLETMETRAMDQAIDLDTNRKKMQQALQDAIDHKDLEAFKDLYKQLYGLAASEVDAERDFTKFIRQNEFMNLLKKDFHMWQKYFDLHMRTSVVQRIWQMSQTDPIMAQFAGAVMGVTDIPTMSDHFVRSVVNGVIRSGGNEADIQAAMDQMQAWGAVESNRTARQTMGASTTPLFDFTDSQTGKSYRNIGR